MSDINNEYEVSIDILGVLYRDEMEPFQKAAWDNIKISIYAREAEITRLQEIISKLDTTEDGLPITPDMELYWHNDIEIRCDTARVLGSFLGVYSTRRLALLANAEDLEAKANEAREKANE